MSNKLVKVNYKQKLEDETAQFVTKVHKLVCLEILMITLFCLFIYGFNLENLMSLEVLGISLLIHMIL